MNKSNKKRLEKMWNNSIWGIMPKGFIQFLFVLLCFVLIIFGFLVWVVIKLMEHWYVI